MIRRLKEHVLKQLPPKRRQIIRLLLKRSDIISAKAASGGGVNHDAFERNAAEAINSENVDGSDASGGCCKSKKLSYQELGIAKLSGFCEWLSIHPLISDGVAKLDANHSAQKMIIFAHHLKVLDGVQEFVCEKGVGFVRIDGNTLASDRQNAVSSFQSSDKIKIAIIGITAGGVGLDFSSAQNVVFLELPQSPSLMLQAEDRAHRRGQSNAVNIYIFCAKDTLDETRWQNLNKSLHRVSSTMDGKYDAVPEILGLLKGGSKRRCTPLGEISHPSPSNAILKKVHLSSSYGQKEKQYTQGWTLMDEPLCKLCQMPCKGSDAKTPRYFEDLFCDLICCEEYRIRTSSRSLRQELFQIEHGVCTICRLDCHQLVRTIKPLSLERRREYIEEAAPNVASQKKLLDKLANNPCEGNAWHADHIVPVYRGGGECKVENMRTLCVACHSKVTAAQRAERCSTREKARKQLEVIMNDMEETATNVKGQGHSRMREEDLVDELLVKVPGSAYSGGLSADPESEELKKSSNEEG